MENTQEAMVKAIQHIQLNDSAWVEEMYLNLIMYFLSKSGKVPEENIIDELEESFSFDFEGSIVDRALEKLESEGLIQRSPSIELKHQGQKQIQGKIDDYEELESYSRDRFETAKEEAGLQDSGLTWDVFLNEILVPLVREQGSLLFRIFRGTEHEHSLDVPKVESLDDAYRDNFKMFIEDYFSEDDPKVAEFLLRHLHVSYLSESQKLSPDAVDMISATTDRTQNIVVYLDTNIIFSILNLHDNPLDSSILELLEIKDGLRGPVELTLATTRMTIEEAKESLRYYKGICGRIRDGVKIDLDFGDYKNLAEKYLSEHSDDVPYDEYFDTWIEGLESALEEQNVSIHNVNFSPYEQDDEIMGKVGSRYKKLQETSSPKSYDGVKHDILTIEYVSNKRDDTGPAKLFETDSWFLTLNTKIMNYERENYSFPISVCIEPRTLIQMLRTWVPRDEDLDAAMIQSMKDALLLQEFSEESERISDEVLSYLTWLEEYDEIGDEIKYEILRDRTLASRVRNSTDKDEKFQVIRDKVVKKVNQKYSHAQDVLREKDRTIEDLKRERQEKQEDLLSKKEDLEEKEGKIDKIERRAEKAEEARDQLKESKETIEEEIRILEKVRDSTYFFLKRFTAWAIISVIGLSIIASFLFYYPNVLSDVTGVQALSKPFQSLSFEGFGIIITITLILLLSILIGYIFASVRLVNTFDERILNEQSLVKPFMFVRSEIDPILDSSDE